MAIIGRRLCCVIRELTPVPCDAVYASFGAKWLNAALICCLYQDVSLLWLRGSVRHCSCSYLWLWVPPYVSHSTCDSLRSAKSFQLICTAAVWQIVSSLTGIIVRGVIRLYLRVLQYSDFIFLALFNWFWYVRVILLSTIPCCLSTYIIKM